MATKRDKHNLGGGPNSFRGGKKDYSVKTLTGNWVEDWWNPSVDHGGFTSTSYATTAHASMLDGLKKRQKYFGTGLPDPPHPYLDTTNVFATDKREHPSTWQTISHSFHQGPGADKVKGFSTVSALPKGLGDEKALEEYRKRWTQESENNRSNHFSTTNNSMLNTGVVPKYQIQETRKLPGLPLSLEHLLKKVHDKTPMWGIQDFSAFLKPKVKSPGGRIMLSDFKSSLVEYGVALSPNDINQLCQFLDGNHTGTVSVPQVLSVLRGELLEVREQAVRQAFQSLQAKARAEGDVDADSVPVKQLSLSYNPKSDFEVVEEKLTPNDSTTRFLSRWSNYYSQSSPGQVVSWDEFRLFYHDMSLAMASDHYFIKTVLAHWGLSP